MLKQCILEHLSARVSTRLLNRLVNDETSDNFNFIQWKQSPMYDSHVKHIGPPFTKVKGICTFYTINTFHISMTAPRHLRRCIPICPRPALNGYDPFPIIGRRGQMGMNPSHLWPPLFLPVFVIIQMSVKFQFVK